ncbi:glycosyltransferase family 2 protein [Carnobacterium pleistocenium]|uniref:glycosyltransferase family 2 protein n=1 Tax=Carnobacterium pleistocenium TaxID=181073 RepID=UPI000A02E917|nr:glycosyltransferase family 2 protein [Carnobacterium pleistocenium]
MKNIYTNSLVSIIVPVYNSEEFIAENLLSILNQDHKNLEAIMVDDGSTDNSMNIIKEIAGNDNRVKYIRQDNQGAPAARNNGLKHSQGDFLYFIDSDDRLSHRAVSLMLISLSITGADIVIGQYQNMDENGNLNHIQDFGYSKPNILTTKKNLKELVFLPPFPGNKMYKMSIIKDNQIKFASVKIAQDLNFYLKALLCANKVSIIDEVVYYYRFRLGSISNTYTKSILEIKESIRDVESFYKDKNQFDQSLFANIKFLYYSYQLSKIPQIKSGKERSFVFKSLKKDLKKINRNSLYPNIYRKKYWNTTLKINMEFIFLSKFYQNYQNKKK